MSDNYKIYVLVPFLFLALSVIMVISTGSWRFTRWVNPSWLLYRSAGIRNISLIHRSDLAMLMELLTITPKLEKVKKFADANSDNAEYKFGWAIMGNDIRGILKNCADERVKYIRMAEQLDPANPMYPYLLGRLYSHGLYSSCCPKYNSDSALAAFDRVAELEPGNAAIDLAKLNVHVQESDTACIQSYYQRRGLAEGKFNLKSGAAKTCLTPEANPTVKIALQKWKYCSHYSDMIGSGLKLLKDSGEDNYTLRSNLLSSSLWPNYHAEISGIRCFIKDIKGSASPTELKAQIDTLTDIMHMGRIIQEDPSASFGQLQFGILVSAFAADLLGDLYLKNNMPSEEACVGEFIAQCSNWNKLWWKTSNQAWRYGLSFEERNVMLTGTLMLLIGFGFALITLVSLTGFLFFRDKYFVKITRMNRSRLWAWVITSMGLITYCLNLEIVRGIGQIELIQYSNFIFVIKYIFEALCLTGIAFTISTIVKKRELTFRTLANPFMIFTAGFTGLLAIYIYPMIAFVLIPAGPVFGAVMIWKMKPDRPAAFWLTLGRLTSELCLIFAIVAVTSWFSVGRKLTDFMEMEEYNKMFNPGQITPITGSQ